ncbi:hypothetical protein O3M35_005351 [Rhynocoris fuscipes]|uniref:Uncharacterized protein n=1 Tax=Rhynocoris fuscipes TaxID=488301 RepID=A0AAW1DHV6_9HEMI
MQKVASEYLNNLAILTDVCLTDTHTDRQKENFLLHFWNQGASKRIFPLRKVYVRKKIPD